MLIDSAKIYRQLNEVRFTMRARNGNNHVLVFFGENVQFLDVVDQLGLNKKIFRTMFVPTTEPPVRTYMDSNLRTKISSNGFRPVRGRMENIDVLKNKNIIIDTSNYFNELVDKYNIKRFLNKLFLRHFENYFNDFKHLKDDSFNKYLYYAIDTTKPFNQNVLRRKFYPFYSKLLKLSKGKDESIDFDKIFLVLLLPDGEVSYRLIYDVNEPVNFPRIRSLLTGVKSKSSSEPESDDLGDLELPSDLLEFSDEEIQEIKRLKRQLD